MKKLALLFALLFNCMAVFAQSSTPEMDNLFRSSGKIYVVITIIAIIFLGLTVFYFQWTED
jgi:protein-S-isoprenylcysteine O-methyltransferase Ste14